MLKKIAIKQGQRYDARGNLVVEEVSTVDLALKVNELIDAVNHLLSLNNKPVENKKTDTTQDELAKEVSRIGNKVNEFKNKLKILEDKIDGQN